jgi:hypothetical protein
MKHPTEIFDEVLADSDPPLSRFNEARADRTIFEFQLLDSVARMAHKTIAEYRKARGPQMPPFYFNYIDQRKLNAFAFFVDQPAPFGFIAASTGTIWLIYDLFYRALSHPKILPTIGNATAERTNRPFSWILSCDYDALLKKRRNGNGHISHVFPKDPERKKYAEKLAMIALKFLVLHEAAHITNGHCGYGNSNGIPLLMEFLGNVTTINNFIWQYIEIVADSHAAVISWSRQPEITDDELNERGRMERGNQIVDPSELLMFDWIFAVGFMFLLLDDPKSKLLEEYDHPPPMERLVLVYVAVIRLLQTQAPQAVKDQWMRAHTKAIEAMNQSIKIIGRRKVQKKFQEYIERKENGAWKKHHDKVMEEGNAVQADIEKFAHYVVPSTTNTVP